MTKSDKKSSSAPTYVSPPDPQTVETTNLGLYGQTVDKANTPETIDKFTSDLYNPANKVLTDTYHLQLGKGANTANNNGTINSIGFQDFQNRLSNAQMINNYNSNAYGNLNSYNLGAYNAEEVGRSNRVAEKQQS